MANPLLLFWKQMFKPRQDALLAEPAVHLEFAEQASTMIFVILRRMRLPLIVLITVFAISVVGLSVIPGVDADGNPERMTLFDSFYFMSYTATTIGFGEIPYPFTIEQRLWVTFSIYLSVIGWAYAIGTLLTLLQDRAFQHAVSLQRFAARVGRLREPFLLIVGYGRAGELLVHDFDALGQQVVVLDRDQARIDDLDLGTYHADIPGLATDAANPHYLDIAGLRHPRCAGVLALTNDDKTNLSVAMTTALLRPDVSVIARTTSDQIADRMRTFGVTNVVNPFERFSEHLRLALNAPASYRLLTWLEAGPGAELPMRAYPPARGRWVMCGYGRFGRELTTELKAAGLEVTVVELTADTDSESGAILGDAADQAVLERADLATAVGLVAGTDDDTTNLSLLANARRINPDLFLAARQNLTTNARLFQAMELDSVLVPTEVVAHEVYAQISTPLLWQFILGIPALGNDWADKLLQRLLGSCGRELPALWKIRLDAEQAPAMVKSLAADGVLLADFMRSPEDRERQLKIVPMLLLRDGESTLCPDRDTILRLGDELMFAGAGAERRELEGTMIVDSTASYVLFDEQIPAGLVWRKLSHYRSK